MHLSISDLLTSRADFSPHSEGMVDSGRASTFREVDDLCNRVASWLQNARVQPGDRVAILAKNSVRAAEMIFAISRADAVVVTLNFRLSAEELLFILRDCAASMLVFDDTCAPLAEELHGHLSIPLLGLDPTTTAHPTLKYIVESGQNIAPRKTTRGGADVAAIMYTSGTTGRPKGAMLTHQNLLFGAVSTTSSVGWQPGERFLLVTPLFHIAGLIPLVTSVLQGSMIYLVPDFEPMSVWRAIEQERITSSMLVPVMLEALLATREQASADVSSLRNFSCGASVVPPDLIAAWGQHGVIIQQVYGLTEFTGSVSYWSPAMGRDKMHSHGRPSFLTEIRIVDFDSRSDLPKGTEGEVICRSPTVFAGYWNNPEATEATIQDGWLATGDVGYIDDEGFLFLVDRRKDMIISGGENIYPAEVELALRSHPDVAEVAIVGRPDAKWGEVPVAFVVTKSRGGTHPSEMINFCRERLAGFKCPRDFFEVESLPRNSTGKVIKAQLRSAAITNENR